MKLSNFILTVKESLIGDRMRIKVTETFQYEGRKCESGNIVELPESVAKSVLKKGYGEKIEDTPTIEAEEVEGKKGPEWKRKIWVSEDRNLGITVWPSGEKFDSPSITLEENRRDESGNWKTNRLYLPTGSSLLALSEHIKSAWNRVQKIKSKEK